MILALYGTGPYQFARMSLLLEQLARERGEEIIAQTGMTRKKPEGVQCYDFLSKKEMTELIQKADIVIGHAGMGTLMDCLSQNKRMILVPRLKERGETLEPGTGQREIAEALEAEGRVVVFREDVGIGATIDMAYALVPELFQDTSLQEIIAEIIRGLVDQIDKKVHYKERKKG